MDTQSAPNQRWVAAAAERLAQMWPERLEALLSEALSHDPQSKLDYALWAIELGELSRAEAAEWLDIDAAELDTKLEQMRGTISDDERSRLVVIDQNGIARLSGTSVTVWEVVREFRRSDSVEGINRLFPNLSPQAIRSALSYAGSNPDEIGAQIKSYEEHVKRSKAAYPYS